MLAISVLVGAWAAVSLSFGVREARFQQDNLAKRAEIYGLFENAPPKTLILVQRHMVRNVWGSGDLVFNPHGLKGEVIVARWLDYVNPALLHYFQGYTPMVLDWADGTFFLRVQEFPDVMPMDFAIRSLHRRTGTNVEDGPPPHGLVRVANPAEHGSGFLIYGRSCYGHAGRMVAEFEVEIRGADAEEALSLSVKAAHGKKEYATRTLSGDLERQIVRLEFSVEDYASLEPQAYYHGNGEVRISAVRLTPLN
jgi:hypothetical protein